MIDRHIRVEMKDDVGRQAGAARPLRILVVKGVPERRDPALRSFTSAGRAGSIRGGSLSENGETAADARLGGAFWDPQPLSSGTVRQPQDKPARSRHGLVVDRSECGSYRTVRKTDKFLIFVEPEHAELFFGVRTDSQASEIVPLRWTCRSEASTLRGSPFGSAKTGCSVLHIYSICVLISKSSTVSVHAGRL
jgi:hypothetical protein